jgi:hypothetical protein
MRQGLGKYRCLGAARKSRAVSLGKKTSWQTLETTPGPSLLPGKIKLSGDGIPCRPSLFLLGCCLAVVGWGLAQQVPVVPQAHAQQVAISTPHLGVGESYFESIGTSWGARGKNWFVQFGGAPVLPGFGTPGAANPGANFGVGWVKGECSAYLWVYGTQGCSRSLIGVTPTVVLPSGGVGWVADIVVTPFVMGFIPVVGYAPIVGFCPVYVFPWQGRPWYCCPCWPGRCWWGPWHTGAPIPWMRERAFQPGEGQDAEVEDPNERFRQAFPRHQREAFPRHAREAFPQGPWAKNLHSEQSRSGTEVGFVPGGKPLRESSVSLDPRLLRCEQQASVSQKQMEFGEESSGRNFRGPLPDETGAQGPKSTAELPVASVAELAALRARELAEREKEAQDYLERARKAQEEGRLGVAKVYYQTAARKSSGRIREAALSALAVLNGSKDVGTADSSRLARQELQRGANDPLR